MNVQIPTSLLALIVFVFMVTQGLHVPKGGYVFTQKMIGSSKRIAEASLHGHAAATKGLITFQQESPSAPVFIRGLVEDIIEPLNTMHGFHVHEHGDLSDNCTAAGGHFNPDESGPGEHAGDHGHIRDVNGTAKFCIKEHDISLFSGMYNVIGNAVVVHQGEDGTQGDADYRIACGVIKLVRKNALEDVIPESMCHHH